jgi:uncharacterized protein (TIGR02246 family)
VPAPENETEVLDLYTRLLSAWNARDAKAYAALFAPDAVVVGFDGSQFSGDEAEGHLTPIFADHPTAAYVAQVRRVRPIGPSALLVHAVVGMIPPGKDALNPATDAVQTLVAELTTAGRWEIVLFQNTPAQHGADAELTELAARGTTVAPLS